MRYIDILEGVEIEIGLLDKIIEKPTTTETEYWVNAAIDKFVKSRTFGNNFRREAFEQTQKRIDDLRTLVSTKEYQFRLNQKDYKLTLPEDYLFTLGETAGIYSHDDCWPKVGGNPVTKHTDVLESTVETVDRQKENVFSEHNLHNNTARPLRLYRGSDIHLYTDGKYFIKSYTLTYMRKPVKIKLTEKPFDEYTDLPSSVHQEIIKLAAQLYIENTGNPRYQTYTNEVNSME